jgi:hypothetical protein
MLDLDRILSATKDATELVPFLVGQLADPDEHAEGKALARKVLPVERPDNLTGR